MLTHLILLTALSLPPNVEALVLRGGQRIAVDGPVTEAHGRVTFRAGGRLYTMPAAEIDVEATRAVAATPIVAKVEEPKRLKVSDEERRRLIQELEKNHSGKPAPMRQLELPPPMPEETKANEDEWAWRTRARQHEEGVRQAQEQADLLKDQIDRLRSQISGFLSLGYRPHQFSYHSAQLAAALEQLPYAQLEVKRAQRQWDQFRDDARRQGILPGWLR